MHCIQYISILTYSVLSVQMHAAHLGSTWINKRLPPHSLLSWSLGGSLYNEKSAWFLTFQTLELNVVWLRSRHFTTIYLSTGICKKQSYEIKSPPWTIWWFRILGIFSVENVNRLGAMMFQTSDSTLSAVHWFTVLFSAADYCLKFNSIEKIQHIFGYKTTT